VYAVSHAATALPIKRQVSRAGLWPLLIAVQAIELLWVLFTYTNVEHIVVSNGRVHLGFLPYSHSVGSSVILAAAAWVIIRAVSHESRVASAVAIGILSHIVLDIVQHEPDIRLFPIAWGPRLGLELTLHPFADATVETAYCVLCWQLFGGSWALLAGILVLNASDLPFMLAKGGAAPTIAHHPSILTTVVLLQIVVSWVVVWFLARQRGAALERAAR
jgi:hypothetical protein